MFTEYIDKAMRLARYELLEDGTFWGQIPGFEDVWGNAPTLEECRAELQSTLEDWLVLGLWMNDETIPKLGKLDLVPRKYAATSRKNESSTSTRTRKAS